jgi:adenosylmethionine-8-amino-7-oxononanoate aminotransferase
MKASDRQIELLKRTFIDFRQTEEILQNPLIFEKADGLYCWDTEGKRYFDALGGVFVALLGHRPQCVIDAMQRQMERMTLAPPLHGIADVTLDLVEKLGSVTPGSLNFVKAFSGGSESIEAAMKFARQYFRQSGHPGKYKFVSSYLSYHGATFAAMSAGGGSGRIAPFEPQMGGFLKVPSPIQLRDQFPSWEECCRFTAQLFENVIVNEGQETVAGVIVEPICNTGGVVTPTAEYFSLLREICSRHNVLLIFDEVLTGFAKTGDMFAAQTFDVIPDIICAGKGLSGGMIPVGAMMAREDMGEAFIGPADEGLQFAHGHTYAGNPLACAAGIAVVDEIEKKKLHLKARDLGTYLKGKLEQLRKFGVVREVRGRGVLLGVELVRDCERNEPFPDDRKLGYALKKTALAYGLIMRIDADWFSICPPLIAEEDDLDFMCDRIEKSLKDALEIVRS